MLLRCKHFLVQSTPYAVLSSLLAVNLSSRPGGYLLPSRSSNREDGGRGASFVGVFITARPLNGEGHCFVGGAPWLTPVPWPPRGRQLLSRYGYSQQPTSKC